MQLAWSKVTPRRITVRDRQVKVPNGRKRIAEEGVLKVTSRLENGRLWAEVQQADRREPILPVLHSDQGLEERRTQAEVCCPGPTGKMRQSGRVLQAEQSSVQLFRKLHKLKADSCWNCRAYRSEHWKPRHSWAGLDGFLPGLKDGTTTQVVLRISKKINSEAKVFVCRNCVSKYCSVWNELNKKENKSNCLNLN